MKNILKNKNNIVTSTVNSTLISNLEYNLDSKILTVRHQDGNVYNYADVSIKDYDALRTAKSVGTQYNKVIKKNYKLIS